MLFSCLGSSCGIRCHEVAIRYRFQPPCCNAAQLSDHSSPFSHLDRVSALELSALINSSASARVDAIQMPHVFARGNGNVGLLQIRLLLSTECGLHTVLELEVCRVRCGVI